MPLMPWHNRNLPACLRLNRVLKQLDPHAFCVWNGGAKRYEVWGRSQAEGHALISVLERDDGTPIEPDLYPMVVLAELAKRDQDPDLAKAQERGAARVRRAWNRALEEAGEMAKYVAHAVGQEAHGALRYGAEDVFRGLELAYGN